MLYTYKIYLYVTYIYVMIYVLYMLYDNIQTCFHGYLYNLGIVFPPQCVVGAELFLELHEGGLLLPLRHLPP